MNITLPRIVSFATLALAAAVCFAQDISVTVNDKPLEFANAQPQFINGRVLVPLRGIFERLGATVRWNQENQSIRATKGDKVIRLTIGSTTAHVNNESVTLDVPPMVLDDSTMVPIRFVSESLGAQVGWNETSKLVSIETKGIDESRPQRISGHHSGMLRDGTVIPVRLNTSLSSETSKRGDAFSARIDSNSGPYSYFPRGTRIIGHVVAAEPRTRNEPGILELAFDRIRMPDGTSYALAASLSGLDGQSVSQSGNGTITYVGHRDNSTVFAGGGNSVVIVSRNGLSRNHPRNAELPVGTRFGVRLDQDLTLNGQ